MFISILLSFSSISGTIIPYYLLIEHSHILLLKIITTNKLYFLDILKPYLILDYFISILLVSSSHNKQEMLHILGLRNGLRKSFCHSDLYNRRFRVWSVPLYIGTAEHHITVVFLGIAVNHSSSSECLSWQAEEGSFSHGTVLLLPWGFNLFLPETEHHAFGSVQIKNINELK